MCYALNVQEGCVNEYYYCNIILVLELVWVSFQEITIMHYHSGEKGVVMHVCVYTLVCLSLTSS